MKRKRYSSLPTLFLGAVTVAASLLSQPGDAASSLDVTAYCDLTVASMEQQVQALEERITLVQTYGDDPVALEEKEAEARQAQDEALIALYESYGTTDTEYSLFMGEEGEAVDAYLAEQVEIAGEIDSLTAQIDALMGQYEALKDDATAAPPPPL
jgi:hypothetical protein